MSTPLNAKQRVANHAANLIEDDMIVGLGTGSTANYFIEALAERQQQGLKCVTVASSIVSTIKAKALGLPQMSIEQLSHLDVYVDGADEVTSEKVLLKGRGSDLVREKLLARASQEFYVLVDQSKLVDVIGQNYPIPIEVMPFAWQLVLSNLQAMGAKGQLRPNAAGDGLAVTSHGSLVLDMAFDKGHDAMALNTLLNELPGVVEHGIFVDLATAIIVADENVDVIEQLR
jgi:ribose 5-phosphate isomerase A